ncbi:CBU_0592 family membrane protein [Flavivirga spongiicola]|uniref:CBU-0592-like domain-containing protein n=1 Tax=Flavivirga spongiicola TaxID=421621 RepID=A0ABU7XS60_9FLAO|nr:hypothetical protein [Flavivirga sp. MEBiC05379]MDO5978283.1 hypothetical protein [Flavivirga sp. MEBiC05379]
MNAIDRVGFLGVFQILLAYALNIFDRLDKNNLTFILLNLVGASLACLASILMNYFPFIILEGVWTVVSLASLIKHMRK